MRPLLALAASALLASCALKRIPAWAGDDRSAMSGVPASFGAPQELPEGTKIVWDFGDGTPPVTAAGKVEHVFPRAGAFTISQTVADKDGEKRTATAKVTVLRRSPTLAVPPEVRAVMIAQWPWARVSLHREAASRLGLRDFYEEIARSVGSAVGFDVTNPEESLKNGFDPDEGMAIFTVPQDAEGMIVAVGTVDEAKAEAALRRFLERDLSARSPALKPFALADRTAPGGTRVVVGTRPGAPEQVAFVFKYGYAYLRTPAATDPLLALRDIDALAPDKGLERDLAYINTVKRVGPGDFTFYSASRPEGAWSGPGPGGAGPFARTFQKLGASAFSVNLKEDRVDVRIFAQLRDLTGQKLLDAFTAQKPPPDLAAALPAGAVAYLKLSGSPAALWQEIGRSAAERKEELEKRLKELLQIDLEKEWLPLFTGNLGAAFYLDAHALLDAVLGEQVAAFDRSTVVVAAEIVPGKAGEVRAALERAAQGLEKHMKVASAAVEGARFVRMGDGAVLAAQRGELLYLAIGGPRDAHEPGDPPLGALGAVLKPAGRSLAEALKRAGVRGFDLPNHQLAYLDIAGAMRNLQGAADEQGGLIGQGAKLVAGRVAGLRDALFEARPSADGIDAQLVLRFARPREE